MEDIRFDGKLSLRIDNVGFISVLRGENFTFEYNMGKEKYSFIYVEEGELEYCFIKEKETLSLKKNEVLYIPKLLPYTVRYLKDNTIIKIMQFDILADTVPGHLILPLRKKSRDFSSVFNAVTRENLHNTLFLSAKIYELLYLMQNDDFSVAKKYRKILPAVSEIKQKYFENQKLAYYSDMCSMSESNFRKLFKEYTGKSPVEYRNYIRISEAKKMIDSGEFTVTETAYLTGFNNMSFFYEVYNKMLGK